MIRIGSIDAIFLFGVWEWAGGAQDREVGAAVARRAVSEVAGAIVVVVRVVIRLNIIIRDHYFCLKC